MESGIQVMVHRVEHLGMGDQVALQVQEVRRAVHLHAYPALPSQSVVGGVDV